MSDMIDDKLTEVKEWAQDRLQSGGEPPWAWYQYTKLVETVDTILEGRGATVTPEELQERASREDTDDPPVSLLVDNDPQGSSQRHPKHIPVKLPM